MKSLKPTIGNSDTNNNSSDRGANCNLWSRCMGYRLTRSRRGCTDATNKAKQNCGKTEMNDFHINLR